VRSRNVSVALALLDLTRMLYFGPAVLSAFLLGAVLAMPEGPMWGTLVRILILGVVGFSGGMVLNDWADKEPDRLMLAARAHHPDYARQLRRERPFTGTRPIAAGIISPGAGFAFAMGLVAVSAGVALTLPSPHRWYVIGALALGITGEPMYCLVKQRQKRLPFATFLSGALVALPAPAGYLAIRRPDRTALLLFVSFYFWEVGFNQLYDTVDAENDRRRGITTLSRAFGLRFVGGWCLALSSLCAAAFLAVWRSAGVGPIMLAGICIAALLLLGTDARLRLRPGLKAASRAIGVHQLFLVIIVCATVADVALRWLSVY